MWKLEHNVATLDHAGIQAHLRTEYPSQGVHLNCLAGDPDWQRAGCAIFMLGIADRQGTCQPKLMDCHVRGRDLIATYQHGDEADIRWQVYWRQLEYESQPGIEIIVGIQTRLLDTRPRIELTTRVPHSPLHESMNSLRKDSVHLLWHPKQPGYLEVAPERPFSGPSISNELVDKEFQTVVRWSMMDERLEKGVIRVARLAGFFFPSTSDPQQLENCCDCYQKSEPPLTA